MKRAACPATAVSAKKAKVINTEVKSLDKITEVLRAANLPLAVADMLCDTLAYVLVPLQGERHEYQAKMVDIVAGELTKIEVQMQAAIEKTTVAVKSSEEEKARKANAVAKAESEVQAKVQTCNDKKLALADATCVFNKVIEASSVAKSEQENGRNGIQAATIKRQLVQALEESLESLHGEPEKIPGAVKQIVKHVNIEEAMWVSLPNALSKDASARQGFDQMVMDQLKLKVGARIAELNDTINNSEPVLEALAKTSQEAAGAVATARDKMIESATTFSATQSEQSAAEAALKSARTDLRDTDRELRLNKRSREDAHAELDLFRDGALASFLELRERSVAQVEDQCTNADKMSGVEPETPALIAVGCGGA